MCVFFGNLSLTVCIGCVSQAARHLSSAELRVSTAEPSVHETGGVFQEN